MSALKALEDQVVVLTGASAGIGLATARRLAARGARLVLVARNGAALDDLVREIEGAGGQALAVPADVGDREAVANVRRRAVERFGRIDTWINDAGVSIYGAVTDVPWEDQRKLFDTNFWGVVAGSLEAVAQFRAQAEAGAPSAGKIVNLGSVLSDRAMIFQGTYSASKHAVKGWTDALRMELAEAGEPVSVTLIKPSAIDTTYMEHARTFMDAEGTRNPPPSYDPDLVADAIEHACEHDARDLTIGAGGWIIGKMGQAAPGLTDLAMQALGRIMQTSSVPARPGLRDNLHAPRRDGLERSAMPNLVPGFGTRRTSLFLEMQKHPAATLTIGTALTLALLVATSGRARSAMRWRPMRTEDRLAPPYIAH